MIPTNPSGHLVRDSEGLRLPHMEAPTTIKVAGDRTSGGAAMVLHELPPHTLAAPPHIHSREDEISYVIEGQVTFRIDEEEIVAAAGSVVVKPRHLKHTFWNAEDRAARVLELITPAGLERYFEELDVIRAVPGPLDLGRLMALNEPYGLTVFPEEMAELMHRAGVAHRR